MDVIQKVFCQIVNMSITASYVAIAVILARFLLKKAPKYFSYMLWSVVFFRLISPVSLKAMLSLFGLFYLEPLNKISFMPVQISPVQGTVIKTGISFLNNNINPYLYSYTGYKNITHIQLIGYIITILWLSGIFIFIMHCILSYWRLKSRIGEAVLLEDNIYRSHRISSPFIFGFIRPKIYIPECVTDEDLPYVLQHEQVHIKRFDHLVKLIAYLVLIVHWFNPLMWICFHLMITDMEKSCDERVLIKEENLKKKYSYILLKMHSDKKFPLYSPLAFWERSFKSRIKNVLNYMKPTKIIVALSIITIVFVGTMSIMDPKAFNRSTGELIDLKAYVIDCRISVPPIELKTYIEDGTLLFTGEDIKEMDWKNQIVKMKQEFMNTRKDNNTTSPFGGGSTVLGVSYDKRFALVLNGELLYEGEFAQSTFSSHLPMGICFTDIYRNGGLGGLGARIILPDTFAIRKPFIETDVRYNQQLCTFLYSHDLLKSNWLINFN